MSPRSYKPHCPGWFRIAPIPTAPAFTMPMALPKIHMAGEGQESKEKERKGKTGKHEVQRVRRQQCPVVYRRKEDIADP